METKQLGSVKRRRNVIAAGVIFIVVILTIGYMSISQSSYKSISDLADVNKRVKVTVEGTVEPVLKGTYTLIVNGKEYYVEGHGSYGVATDSTGKVYVIFILSGDNFAVLALYDVGENTSAYQLGSGLASNVVVSGIYDPTIKAVLSGPGGSVELPYLEVSAILKGCHSSYEQGVGTRG